MRKVAVITGTRADYGIVYPVLKAIDECSELELRLIVTGMHYIEDLGYTVEQILKDGFRISFEGWVHIAADIGEDMANEFGMYVSEMAQALYNLKPDWLIVLGDRGEMLAGAIVATHMGIPVIHLQGGDVTTGACIDEPIRHSITRFAHLHFPSTEQSANRLVKMGEELWRVQVVGPLGIYAMPEVEFTPEIELRRDLGIANDKPIVLVVQHPVTTQIDQAPEQMRATLEAVSSVQSVQSVIIYPNSDAGGREMIKVIEKYPQIRSFKSLPYLTFLSLLKASSVLVGNSSVALLEAPLFGIPVVNIGDREKGREIFGVVYNVFEFKSPIIAAAIGLALFGKKLNGTKVPKRSTSGVTKIIKALIETPIDARLLQKRLSY